MTGFWDDPRNWPSTSPWPSQPGESIEGVITRMQVRTSRYGRLQLCIELDSDGRERWCNSRLWRAIGESRADITDRIKVTRGPDDRDVTPGANGHLPSTWTVERLPMRPSDAAAPSAWDEQPQAKAARGPTW